MLRRILPALVFLFLLLSSVCLAAQAPAPKDVDLTAADGVKLKATYFASAKPGPGILLLHQCNENRKMWSDLAPKLVAAGFNVMTLDFRGFGESGDVPVAKATPQQRNEAFQKFGSDVDVAYGYLVSQPGVKKVIGAAGASCGVNESVQLARRHPEVKSLVLLSGPSNAEGRRFLKQSSIPVLGAGAEDDEFPGSLEETEWLTGLSTNPGNEFLHYKTGRHGIEMFGPHPELASTIVNWFSTTLIKTPGHAPADAKNPVNRSNVLARIDEPGGAAKIAELLKSDPRSVSFPEAQVNLLGYEHIQSGDKSGAIEILKLNTIAFPNSPNVYDSLADAYVADGQNQRALENAKKALELLASDTNDDDARKQGIRQSAEQKVKQLQSGE